MSKGIELTQSQIKALQSGATMFIFPISDYDLNRINKGYSIGDSNPINKGDKDIFVQEEFWQYENDILYKSNSDSDEEMLLNGDYEPTSSFIWSNASQMTKEQSRFSFNECIDAKAIRVKDITIESKIKIIGHINTNMELNKDAYNENFIYHYNKQLKEQNINRTYEDNDYVFLVEFKR